jgi:hypothetical protein
MANWRFVGGLLVLQGACSAPLPSNHSTPLDANGVAVGSGGATVIGVATSLGGATTNPTQSLGGAGGPTTVLAQGGAGGTAPNFTPTSDPNFDPSVLVVDPIPVVDAGTALDADGVHSTGIVIFDRSGSMEGGWTTAETDNPDSAVSVTKWVAASRALLGALEPVQDRVTIGAVLFPSDDGCGVAPFGDPVQFAFMPARQFIEQYVALSPYNQPQGNTPLTLAFQAADQAIQAAASQGMLQTPFFVMLLTDGEPNCGSDMTQVLALVASWREQGIPTHVFGLPGSESARMVLDSVAQAGGTQTLVVPGTPQGAADLQGGIAAVF